MLEHWIKQWLRARTRRTTGVESSAMRPGTTIAIVALLAIIVVAGVLQLFFLAR